MELAAAVSAAKKAKTLTPDPDSRVGRIEHYRRTYDVRELAEMLADADIAVGRASALKGRARLLQGRVTKLRAMLVVIQRKHFHEPDSDFHEYCNGCGRSPFNEPPHKDDCLVPLIERLLKGIPE